MLTKLFTSALLLASLVQAQAQTDNKTSGKKEENIVIRKKGNDKEKLTIVIDGDKITVNGKPVDEFKNGDIKIIHDGENMNLNVAPFARSFDMRRDFLPPATRNYFSVMDDAKSNKAMLGVVTEKAADGAKITQLTKASAAAKAGLLKNDIITKAGDEKIADAADLYKAIGKYNPDDKVKITYKRGAKEDSVTAVLGKSKLTATYNFDNKFRFAPELDGVEGFANGWNKNPRMGIQIQDTEDGSGVKILDVDEDTPAGKAGLKEDDIITEANGKTITSVDELRESIKDSKPGDLVKLRYKRDNISQSAEIKFPKKLKTTDL